MTGANRFTGVFKILTGANRKNWSIQDYRIIQNMTGVYRITGACRI